MKSVAGEPHLELVDDGFEVVSGRRREGSVGEFEREEVWDGHSPSHASCGDVSVGCRNATALRLHQAHNAFRAYRVGLDLTFVIKRGANRHQTFLDKPDPVGRAAEAEEISSTNQRHQAGDLAKEPEFVGREGAQERVTVRRDLNRGRRCP